MRIHGCPDQQPWLSFEKKNADYFTFGLVPSATYRYFADCSDEYLYTAVYVPTVYSVVDSC